jgi:hypothetical protein
VIDLPHIYPSPTISPKLAEQLNRAFQQLAISFNLVTDLGGALLIERGASGNKLRLDPDLFPVDPLMKASGPGSAAGDCPDPGGVAGTSKFLREDATWAVPAGAAAFSGAEYQGSGASVAVPDYGTSVNNPIGSWTNLIYDTDSYQSGTTNFVIPQTGYYLGQCRVTFPVLASAYDVWFFVYTGANVQLGRTYLRIGTNVGFNYNTDVWWMAKLTGGTVVFAAANQDFGSSINVTPAFFRIWRFSL